MARSTVDLPGAALADQAEALALGHGKADIVDRMRLTLAMSEADVEPVDLDHASQAGSRLQGGKLCLGPGRAWASSRAGRGCKDVSLRAGGWRLTALDDAAAIHDQHAVAERGDQLEVVADEDQAGAAAGDHLVEDAQNLQRDGDVQGRGRFVGDDDVGLGDHHHGDHHPLAHAAGQFVGVAVIDPLGIADAHGGQHVDRPLSRLATAGLGVHQIGLGDLVADLHHRVEAVFGILQDHRDARPADAAHLPLAGGRQIDAVERQLLGADAAIGGGQAQDGAAGLRLAGAALADNAQLLAAEAEADAAHGLDEALGGAVGDIEILDLEQ